MLGQYDYHKAETIEELSANLTFIQNKIERACVKAGRDPKSVRLLPVSKTVDEARIRMAQKLGVNYLGENKVQEALSKYEATPDLPIRWAVIGHLQSNKVKYVARFAAEFQALDSVKIAEKLNQRLALENRNLDVLIQVNTSGEKSKYGLLPEMVPKFVEQIKHFDHLNVKGLMTLALLSGDSEKVRNCFILLRKLRNQLKENLPKNMNMDELSMGMSGDFDIAIEEGATIVRVGQAIFGSRTLTDKH